MTFHADSFGYRQGKSAQDALELADKRCKEFGWAIDLDIKGFFDNLDHNLLIKGLVENSEPLITPIRKLMTGRFGWNDQFK